MGQPQVPEMQGSPAAHAWLHVPQCAVLVDRETHSAPHAVRSEVVHEHTPDEQICPLPHALPHVPQLAVSDDATQTPLQCSPLGHRHDVPSQISPGPQSVVQPPQ
jgi:hypothetical protein